MALGISTVSELSSVCEETVEVDGDHVPRTAFAAVDNNENAYFGTKLGIHIRELTPDIAQDSLEQLPDDVYPPFPSEGLTAAPNDIEDCFIKRPSWSGCLDPGGKELIPKLMLQEATTMEFLAKHPHPNIVKYYGCRVKRGRITGLVLETFNFKNDLMAARTHPELFKSILDKYQIMSGVRSALDHLHELGLAHNDLNPSNIMLGDEGKPKLIDFGSCQPFGESLMSFGTRGWSKEEFTTSDKENDEYGYSLLGPWLDNMVGNIRQCTS